MTVGTSALAAAGLAVVVEARASESRTRPVSATGTGTVGARPGTGAMPRTVAAREAGTPAAVAVAVVWGPGPVADVA